MKMKKALLFFADGAEEVEALTPVDLLRRAGVEVTVVGVLGKTQTGSHGISVNTDVPAEELGECDFDMVILPGGLGGTKNLGLSEVVARYVSRAANEGKFIAAICAAPTVLGKMGLLKGKNATCYPSMQDDLAELYGAKVGGRVVRDGNIITGVGAGASTEFALALIEALTDAETSEKIKNSIVAV